MPLWEARRVLLENDDKLKKISPNGLLFLDLLKFFSTAVAKICGNCVYKITIFTNQFFLKFFPATVAEICCRRVCKITFFTDYFFCNPSYNILIRFAKIFKVSTDYLLGVEKKKTLNIEGLTNKQVDSLITIANEYQRLNGSFNK